MIARHCTTSRRVEHAWDHALTDEENHVAAATKCLGVAPEACSPCRNGTEFIYAVRIGARIERGTSLCHGGTLGAMPVMARAPGARRDRALPHRAALVSVSPGFSEQFYAPDGCDPHDPSTFLTPSGEAGRPTSLLEALWRMRYETNPVDFQAACKQAGIAPDAESSQWDLMQHARHVVDTVDGLRTPVGVYLDEAGDFVVEVF